MASEYADKMKEFQQAFVGKGFKPSTGLDIYKGPEPERLLDKPEAPLAPGDFLAATEVLQASQEASRSDSEEEESHLETKQASEEESRKRKSNNTPFKQRINQMTAEKKAIEEHNTRLQQSLWEAQERATQMAAELEQTRKFADKQYEQTLKVSEETLIERLREAKLTGDVDAEIAIGDRLADIKTDKVFYKKEKNKPKEYHVDDEFYSIPSAPYVAPDAPANPEYVEWLDRNSWCDKNSQDYTPSLETKANEIADYFNEGLILNGQKHMIGTREYFDAIDQTLRGNFTGGPVLEEPRSEARAPSRSPVTPIGRAGANLSDRTVENKPSTENHGISLSQLEINMVRNNGFEVGRGKRIYGQEAIKYYAEQKKRRMETQNYRQGRQGFTTYY